MRLWAGEKIARVWVGDTVFRVERGIVRIEERVTAAPDALDVSLDEVAAWSPAGQRLDHALVTHGRSVLDAVALDDVRIAAVLARDGEAPRLVIGPPAGPFEAEIALATPGVQRARADVMSAEGPGRSVRVHASAHGIAVAARSGHVVVVRPGAREVSFVLRVATQGESVLDAVPTPEGVLVTELVSGRSATVRHLASDGTQLGHWQGFASFPALFLDVDRALAYDDERHVVVLLSLPALGEVALAQLEDDAMPCEAAVRPQGGSVVIASSTAVHTVTIKRTSLVVRGPYALDRNPAEVVAKPPPSKATKTLREVSGAPAIGFPNDQRSEPPWHVSTGDDAPLTLRVRSVGGPGRGIAIALGGAAVEQGLVSGVSVRAEGDEAPLAREGTVLRGVLPDVDLPAGLENVLSPTKAPSKDEHEALAPTHFTVELVVRGSASGSALLAVSVSALEGTGIKRTRPVTVS